MNNLLVIGYYGFRDGYYSYGKYFKDSFDSVSFFPLVELRDRISEKNQNFSINDIKNVILGNNLENKNLYSGELKNTEVNKNYVIIAHNFDFIKSFMLGDILFYDYIIKLKNELNFKLICFNWDPDLNNLKWEGIQNFDKIFTAYPFYTIYDNCFHFKQGFCENTSYYYKDEKYKCDVSFIGTNLYTDDFWTNKELSRKKILDKLYNDPNISLHIYGTENLKNDYPLSYKGYINYDECYKVFSNSLINLNISPIESIEFNNDYYYSERLPQIIGCESIMLSNNKFGNFLVPDKDYIYLSNINNLINVVYKIKNNIYLQNYIKINLKKKKYIFNYKFIMKEVNNILLS